MRTKEHRFSRGTPSLQRDPPSPLAGYEVLGAQGGLPAWDSCLTLEWHNQLSSGSWGPELNLEKSPEGNRARGSGTWPGTVVAVSDAARPTCRPGRGGALLLLLHPSLAGRRQARAVSSVAMIPHCP